MEALIITHILSVILISSSLIPSLEIRYKKIAAFFVFLALVFIWYKTGFPPFINGRTSTLFFGAILLFRSFFNLGSKTAFFTRITALVMSLAGVFIPVSSNKVDAILSSFWLGIHVPFFFLGYLSLTIAFISSLLNDERTEKKEAMLALLFLFLGLFTGAIWAEISWGRFFGFDPKEVWTLALIISLSSYFFSNKRIQRKSILAVSFFLMLATYLVVSFILPGMHSYV